MKLIFVILFLFFFLIIPFESSLATGTPPRSNPADPANPVTLTNPMGTSDPDIIIGKIIGAILGVVGSLALVMFIYGGFTWMTAAGSSEKVKKGKDILIWAVLGLVVIFASYAIVRFVLSGLA